MYGRNWERKYCAHFKGNEWLTKPVLPAVTLPITPNSQASISKEITQKTETP